MTISFNPLKANGQLFTHLPELDDLEVSLSIVVKHYNTLIYR